ERLVERERVEPVTVPHRRVHVAVLDVRPVATGIQLDRTPVLRMLAQHPQRRGSAPRAAPSARLRRIARLELEADLAVGLANEIRGERPPRARRDELQEIGLARREQLLHLRPLDWPLQDHAPRTEIAALVRTHRVLADISLRQLEDALAAL